MPQILCFACCRSGIKLGQAEFRSLSRNHHSTWWSCQSNSFLKVFVPSSPGSFHGCLLIIRVSAQRHFLRDTFLTTPHQPFSVRDPNREPSCMNHTQHPPAYDLIMVKPHSQNWSFLRAGTCSVLLVTVTLWAHIVWCWASLNTCWIPEWLLQADKPWYVKEDNPW